jgi:hypothetical protein
LGVTLDNRLARLPYIKTVAQFDFSFHPIKDLATRRQTMSTPTANAAAAPASRIISATRGVNPPEQTGQRSSAAIEEMDLA